MWHYGGGIVFDNTRGALRLFYRLGTSLTAVLLNNLKELFFVIDVRHMNLCYTMTVPHNNHSL